MGIIEDLAKAIDNYPSANVEITVTDFKEPGTHINKGEKSHFKVRVRNKGMLDMKNVRLHLRGTAYATVSVTHSFFGSPSNFRNSVISSGRNINAHSSSTFGEYHMRAEKVTTENRTLFTAHISSFDASLDHILRDHSHHAGSPQVSYKRHIHPS